MDDSMNKKDRRKGKGQEEEEWERESSQTGENQLNIFERNKGSQREEKERGK